MRRLLPALALVLVGCEPALLPLDDAGRTSPADAGFLDAGSAEPDAGAVDGGGADAGPSDAGAPDSGSAADAGLPDSGALTDGGADAGAGADAGCRLVFCFNGAPSRTSASNFPFNDLCDSLLGDGLVRDCAQGTCYSTFDTFLVNAATALYPKVYAALDTNRDSRVDAADQQCAVVFLGYSWGGVASVEVADALLADTRLPADRRAVNLIVALDPFQPTRSTLDVPAGVRAFHEFRHSTSPSNDCSATAPLGPYRGLPPRCRAASTCVDYDFSLAPTTAFPRYTSGSYTGAQIGHCEVPEVTHSQARALVRAQAVTGAPPQRTVPTIP